MDAILVAIDGTGPFWNSEYNPAFQHSFVKTIHEDTTACDKLYIRGPSAEGLWSADKAYEGIDFINRKLLVRGIKAMVSSVADKGLSGLFSGEKPQPKIWIAGYSRGAAAAIYMAKIMAPHPVDYLVLFDAVNKLSPIPNGAVESIPANVVKAIHVLRDPSVGSREFFGNCGKSSAVGPVFIVKHHKTTHGGVGGTPWCLDPSLRAGFQPIWTGGRLEPSPKWKERVQEMSESAMKNYALAKYATNAPLFPNKAKTDKALKDAVSDAVLNAYTNITFEDDLKGSKAVWSEIGGMLVADGLIKSSKWPWSSEEAKMAMPGNAAGIGAAIGAAGAIFRGGR